MKRAFIVLVYHLLLGAGVYGLLQLVPENESRGANGITTDTAAVRDFRTVVPASGEVLPLLKFYC